MRITIESTDSEPEYSMKSVVEVPYDDVDINELWKLFKQATLGFGYADYGDNLGPAEENLDKAS